MTLSVIDRIKEGFNSGFANIHTALTTKISYFRIEFPQHHPTQSPPTISVNFYFKQITVTRGI